MSAMKWWGWGDEGVAFTHADKPELGPFLHRVLGLDVNGTTARPVAFADLDIAAPPRRRRRARARRRGAPRRRGGGGRRRPRGPRQRRRGHSLRRRHEHLREPRSAR